MTHHSRLSRRVFAAAVLCTAALSAIAQDKYPSKPITLVVPQAAGGANDAIARVLAQKLGEQLGQTVIVENRPGAGGTLATGTTARARNDGYTLLLTADSAHVIGPALYKNPGFDPVKDFAPVAPVATAGYVLVAHPSFPGNNVAELVALAKASPGKYSIASAGNGTLNHLIGEMLQKAAGIQLQHIPYKGSAAAATDVVGGQVPLSVQSLPSAIAFIKAGKLKVLGVVNEQRVAALPDAPTIGGDPQGLWPGAVVRAVCTGGHARAHRGPAAGRGGPRAGAQGRGAEDAQDDDRDREADGSSDGADCDRVGDRHHVRAGAGLHR